jgi:hypothetical protein
MTRAGVPCLWLAADAPSVHDRRRDTDEVVAFPGDPGDQGDPLQAADLGAAGDRPSLSPSTSAKLTSSTAGSACRV